MYNNYIIFIYMYILTYTGYLYIHIYLHTRVHTTFIRVDISTFVYTYIIYMFVSACLLEGGGHSLSLGCRKQHVFLCTRTA